MCQSFAFGDTEYHTSHSFSLIILNSSSDKWNLNTTVLLAEKWSRSLAFVVHSWSRRFQTISEQTVGLICHKSKNLDVVKLLSNSDLHFLNSFGLLLNEFFLLVYILFDVLEE